MDDAVFQPEQPKTEASQDSPQPVSQQQAVEATPQEPLEATSPPKKKMPKSNFPLKKLIILFIVFILILVSIKSRYFAQLGKSATSLNSIERDPFDRKIQNYLKDEVGEDYFLDNFKFVKSQFHQGSTAPPLVSNDTQSHIYEFLPFSGKYKYHINVSIDIETEEIYQDLLPCVFGSSPSRCDFPITYSQAYDKAKEKLASATVKLVEKDEEYYWKATNIQGDPLCAGLFTYFFIDVSDGSETQIEERRSNFCI